MNEISVYMRSRLVAAVISTLLIGVLAPLTSSYAADPSCGPAPLPLCPLGSANPTPAIDCAAPPAPCIPPAGAPSGLPANMPSGTPALGSGFVSKYPPDRSVDLFSAAEPEMGKNLGKYYGVSFDSSMRFQNIPYVKAENQNPDNTRNEYLCTGVTDSACSASRGWETLFIEGGIGNCSANPNTACVESFSIITSDGKEIVAHPLVKFPAGAKEFVGKVNSNGSGYAAGLAPWIWRAEGDGPGSEHDYLLTGTVQSGAQVMNGNFDDLHVIAFAFEAIPIVREISTLIKAPEKIMQKHPSGAFNNVMSSNYETSCLANDTGVCLHRREFQAGSKLKVALQLPKFISGWLNGRLSNPTVSSTSISTTSDRVVVEAAPEKNIFAGKWVTKKDIPKLTYKSDKAAQMFMTFDSGTMGFSVRDSGEDGALDAYTTWSPYLGENAFAINSTWTISSTLSGNPSSCVKTGAGVQGIVSTNASAYDATAPTYNKSDGTLDYHVAAPHFDPSGKIGNTGTYSLAMKADLIQCLYGVSKLPSSASIAITNSNGSESIQTVSLSQRGGWVFLNADNFSYSSPTLKIKLNQSDAATSTSTPTPPIAATKASTSQGTSKITITCAKGKTTKKVTGAKPVCPTGYKKK